MKAVIVIPTYNEANSIGKMIDYLFEKVFPSVKGWTCQILVVDDTSPDGTYKIVAEKQKKYQDLFLSLSKEKSGIGGGYVRGFKYAMDELHADVIIEFDADFQHPPEDIPVMLAEIDKGADYVLGSRNIPGGSVPKSWNFTRVFLSKFGGGFVARIILFFPWKSFFQITDPTTGLKASRVKGFVDHMDLDHLYSRQFGYKLEFLYQMVKLKAKVKEIPLRFSLRETGESKISPQTPKDILRSAILLRWFDPFTQKIMKFGTVGFAGYLVNALTLLLFTRLNFPSWGAWGLSTELAIINNFIFNNIWTFRDQQIKGVRGLVSKFLQFNLTSTGGLLIQVGVGMVTDYLIGSQYRQIVLPLTVVFLVLPYNYLMYTLVIWRKKAPSQK